VSGIEDDFGEANVPANTPETQMDQWLLFIYDNAGSNCRAGFLEKVEHIVVQPPLATPAGMPARVIMETPFSTGTHDQLFVGWQLEKLGNGW